MIHSQLWQDKSPLSLPSISSTSLTSLSISFYLQAQRLREHAGPSRCTNFLTCAVQSSLRPASYKDAGRSRSGGVGTRAQPTPSRKSERTMRWEYVGVQLLFQLQIIIITNRTPNLPRTSPLNRARCASYVQGWEYDRDTLFTRARSTASPFVREGPFHGY